MRSELIASLTAELRPRRREPSLSRYMAHWFFGVVIMVALVLPVCTLRLDIASRVQEPRFWLESLAWLTASMIAASLVYLSSIPSRLTARELRLGLLPVMMVASLMLLRFHGDSGISTFRGEMDLYRGRCGIIILAVGLLGSFGIFTLIREYAPTRPALTGVFMAASAGCLGSFLMQFVCQYENTLHLFLWHFLPLVFLGVLGQQLGRKLLNW